MKTKYQMFGILAILFLVLMVVFTPAVLAAPKVVFDNGPPAVAMNAVQNCGVEALTIVPGNLINRLTITTANAQFAGHSDSVIHYYTVYTVAEIGAHNWQSLTHLAILPTLSASDNGSLKKAMRGYNYEFVLAKDALIPQVVAEAKPVVYQYNNKLPYTGTDHFWRVIASASRAPLMIGNGSGITQGGRLSWLTRTNTYSLFTTPTDIAEAGANASHTYVVINSNNIVPAGTLLCGILATNASSSSNWHTTKACCLPARATTLACAGSLGSSAIEFSTRSWMSSAAATTIRCGRVAT